MELIGGRRRQKDLKVLKHAAEDAEIYFGQFAREVDAECLIKMDCENSSLKGFALVMPQSRTELERRFPGVASLYSTIFQHSGPDDALPLGFGPDTNYVCIENCLLINTLHSAVRIRNVQVAVIIQSDVQEKDYLAYLRDHFRMAPGREISGVQMLPGDQAEKLQLVAQFANIYLMNGLREVSIGQFLDQHSDIITTALDAHAIITEPHLTWQTASPDPDETAINPDLFVIRKDGSCDVFDLKLPLLNRKRLTKGERRRRRFVDAVDEGIAQLAHYREFLDIPENRKFSEAKYGVTFSNPRYGLIVGNYENLLAEEVKEASRRLGDFVLIDYDTLLQLYIGRLGIDPLGNTPSAR